MRQTTRALYARLRSRSTRQNYWATTQLLEELNAARADRHRVFWGHVRNDLKRYLSGSVRPEPGATLDKMNAAVQWLLRAQRATNDDGVSLGYFPTHAVDNDGWLPSYPETTGYIISTLIAYGRAHDDAAAVEAAIRMGHWEAGIQMPTGAVQGGQLTTPDKQTPAAFNTGMVLDGWCSLLELRPDETLSKPARAAADFLVRDLDDHSYFRTNGAFVSTGEIKTYTCLCAWAIHRFGDIVGEASYRAAAIRSIEAALRQQRPNGWFAHNCLTRSEAPLTHTIGYTLQGVLEVGVLAGRAEFVDAVRRSVDAIAPRIAANGYLPGRLFPDWTSASMSSCLTGSAQIAIVAYRLADILTDATYRTTGDRLLNCVKAVQVTGTGNPGIDGAIAGSFPIYGEYMRGGYPNWATKYFVDALLLQHRNATVGI